MRWPFRPGSYRLGRPSWQREEDVLCADSAGVSNGRSAFDASPVFAWSEVRRIDTYKVDLFTSDQICLAFRTDAGWIELNEEQPGWTSVCAEMMRAFPSIPKGWLDEVMRPAFATKQRTLYER